MADIFLSYAREDRAIAERLASAIEASGKSVWWDRHIKGGAQFSKDIERELHAATHVLVLWSAASVESRWVRDEASHAADNNRLVGATIDGTSAPLGFGQFHTVDLQGWGKTGAALPDDLAHALDADPVAPSPPLARTPGKSKGLVVGGIAAALALAGIGAVALDLPEAIFGQEDARDLTIAVLPFAVQDTEANLGRALAGSLLDNLGSSQGFDLVSSTSSFAEQDGTAIEIAQRLGASHLVEGDLRQDGETLRLTLRIVDGANGRPVWNHTLEQQDGNREDLTARATTRLSAGIQAWLGVGSGAIGDVSGVPEAAIEDYRRGLEEMIAEDGFDAFLGAFHHFGSAADRAPDWAPAHGARALTMMQFGPQAVALDVDEFLELQVSTYTRALELDPDDPWARTARAGHLLFAETEIDASIEVLRAVTADYPDLVQPKYMLAPALILAAEYRDALTVIDRTIALSPPAKNTLARNRISALRGLGRYWDIERMVRECRAQCDQLASGWLQAILAEEDVSERWLEGRIERFDELLAELDSSDSTRSQYQEAIRYWHFGGPEPEIAIGPGIVGAAFAARQGELDLTFERISYIGDEGTPSLSASNFLYDDGLELPEAVRRDPRYAELFDRGRFKDVEAYRREKGILSGLPIREEE